MNKGGINSPRRINWWVIVGVELVFLLLMFTGFGIIYLSLSDGLPINNSTQKELSSVGEENNSILIQNNMSDQFVLEGVKVNVSRIGYDKFLSSIIGSLGEIEEVKIAGFTGIYTAYVSEGESKQQLYVLTADEKGDLVVVITVTNESVTQEDIVKIVESLNERIIPTVTPTPTTVSTDSLVIPTITQTSTKILSPTPPATPDPSNFGECIYGCVSENRFNK
jgi:hypothetical protein